MQIKILIVYFLFGFNLIISSQTKNKVSLNKNVISIGYRNNFGSMDAYQSVVGYYNDSRPWLDRTFNENGYMHGIELGFGATFKKGGLSALRFYINRKKDKASGENNGTSYTRTIKTYIVGLELVDFWYTPIHIKNFNLGFGVMPLGGGIFRVRTKLNEGEYDKIPLSDLEKNFSNLSFIKTSHWYVNVHADLTRIYEQNGQSFHLQFFYTIAPRREYDLFYLNQQINPSNYFGIRQRTLQKMSNFGIKLMYNF